MSDSEEAYKKARDAYVKKEYEKSVYLSSHDAADWARAYTKEEYNKCPNEEWECTRIQKRQDAEIDRLRGLLNNSLFVIEQIYEQVKIIRTTQAVDCKPTTLELICGELSAKIAKELDTK